MTTFQLGHDVKTSLRLTFLPQAVDYIEQFELYLRDLRRAESTIRSYLTDIRLTQAAVGKPLVEARTPELDRYFRDLSRTSIKAGTISRRRTSLGVFYRWAILKGYVTTSPVSLIETPKREHNARRALSREQVAAVFAALRHACPLDIRDAALTKCFYYTGMRLSEVASLTWEQLTSEVFVIKGKGKRERKVYVVPELRTALEQWRKVHPTGKGHIFVSMGDEAGPLSPCNLRDRVNTILESAGLAGQGFSPHSFRHTFATHLRDEGWPLDKIQVLLGHSSIETTMIYTKTNLGPGDYQKLIESLKTQGEDS